MPGILDQASFQSELERAAMASNRPLTEVRAEAARDLAEMHGRRNALAVRLFAGLSRFVYRRGYRNHPVFDFDELANVRRECRERSVIFLVTHKTYLDFFVLFDFLYRHGVPTPYIFGGLNMNFAGFGGLARRAGGIFIRRSFRDDIVYKAVLRRYIESLIENGCCFMWAIEGTRSRTGKLLMPRLGLLNYVSSIGRNLGDDTIRYIPVSVVYDQIPDVVDMAAQDAGMEKKPENLPWFLEYVRGLGRPFGDIHIRFGDAMTMAETPAAPDFESSAGEVNEQRIEVQKLAFEACYRINEITPATMTSLVLMALLCRGPCDQARIRSDVAALSDYIRQTAQRVISRRPSRNLSTDPMASIDALISTGVLRTIAAEPQRMLEIEPGKLSVAIYYSNMAVHHFVISAFTELALLASGRSPEETGEDGIWAEHMRLRNLFKFEFFFSRNAVFREQIQFELDTVYPQWRSLLNQGEEAVRSMLKNKSLLVAPGVLSPFIAAYRLVGEMLAENPENRQLPDKEFISRCLERAAGKIDRSGKGTAPAVSRALLANGLRMADYRRLRTGEDPGAKERTVTFLDELEFTAELLRDLDMINQTV